MNSTTIKNLENDLMQSYKIAAKTVHLFGDKYLPLFQRLHKEIEQRSNDKSMKFLALQIANE